MLRERTATGRRAGFLQAMVACLLSASTTFAAAATREGTAPQAGIRSNPTTVIALTGGRVHTQPGRVIEDATVVIRDGLISAVGQDVEIPSGARVWELAGRNVYAGFIESRSEMGVPEDAEAKGRSTFGAWNAKVTPERSTADTAEWSADAAKALRELGFTSALVTPRQGVFRGSSSLVSLGSAASMQDATLLHPIHQHLAFENGSWPDLSYPGSLMGAIALVRQTLLDARWYQQSQAHWRNNGESQPQPNEALAALRALISGDQQVIAATEDELDYQRWQRIADEFDLSFNFAGNGHEYRRAAQIAQADAHLILPINFPEAPAVEQPDVALDVSLESLQHWELAPSNPAILQDAGVTFSLTTYGLEAPAKSFWGNVRKAVKRGLSESDALAALTTRPASLAGVSDRLGSIARGKLAHLAVAKGNPFSDDDAAFQLFVVDGEVFETDDFAPFDPEGLWRVSAAGLGDNEWTIKGDASKLTVDAGDHSFDGRLQRGQLILFPHASVFGGDEGQVRMTASYSGDALLGVGETADGRNFQWSAKRTGPLEEEESEEDAEDDADSERQYAFTQYPAGAYGVESIPEQPDTLFIKDATLWTSSDAGVIENGDLLIRDGKIRAVGEDLTAPRNAMVIDAGARHVTAGLIDAHSHTGISRGTNEGTDAVTVEVRIGDVLDPTDIGLYRELAGGLTVANVLHGSANPMGGQNQVIKLRWGGDAESLKFDGARPGVKFALGENVKQSNWGDDFTTRYPQTRMGVPEIMRDTFDAAREYGEARRGWNRRSGEPQPRRNLRLDAALEILEGDRDVHIHSYRQDEILAFARLAAELGLSVATFQHVLEGYKVADAMAEIGAGGSTFSDWWAYKFEVIDAIPYNGVLMQRAGVNVSFNSDSSELARRMNTEAAKAVRYGGMSETDALNLVTINPARQLGVGDQVGSLEEGKDGDFVLWSDNPLSTFAVAEQTWVDGRKYFDREIDRRWQQQVMAERRRLIQLALPERLKAIKVAEGKPPTADDPAEGGELIDPGPERIADHLHHDAEEHVLLQYRGLYHDGQDLMLCTHGEGH